MVSHILATCIFCRSSSLVCSATPRSYMYLRSPSITCNFVQNMHHVRPRMRGCVHRNACMPSHTPRRHTTCEGTTCHDRARHAVGRRRYQDQRAKSWSFAQRTARLAAPEPTAPEPCRCACRCAGDDVDIRHIHISVLPGRLLRRAAADNNEFTDVVSPCHCAYRHRHGTTIFHN